ncbi:MAG: glycosyltransferase family 2 protein, partial [Coriobacteriia bacterium]
LKLVMGRWDYTDTGLLDETHVRFYTESSLKQTLAKSGLHLIARDDLILEKSDQAFPPDHPILQRRTTLRTFLDMVRQRAEVNSAVNQFVWLCHSGPLREVPTEVPSPEVFLSVLIRTRGRRLHELRETLLCLLAQTVDDFEVLLLLHEVSDTARDLVRGLLAEFPPSLTARVRVIDVNGGTRARPLNVGFDVAVGRYVAVLDDDDHVMAHWVETFQSLEADAGGRLIRARCAVQRASVLEVRGRVASSANGGIELPYDPEFALLAHLIDNQTPFMSVAFPRGLFTHLGMKFDESLSTTEDWDFILRSSSIAGVLDSPEVTAIYRRWSNNPASRTDHRPSEWASNRGAIDRKMDLEPILLSAGEARVLRERLTLSQQPSPLAAAEVQVQQVQQVQQAQQAAMVRVASLIESRSWRATQPIRALVGMFRGKPVRVTDIVKADERTLVKMASEIESSHSWRFAQTVRRIVRFGR